MALSAPRLEPVVDLRKCRSAIPRDDVSVTPRAAVESAGLHWLAASGQP